MKFWKEVILGTIGALIMGVLMMTWLVGLVKVIIWVWSGLLW